MAIPSDREREKKSGTRGMKPYNGNELKTTLTFSSCSRFSFATVFARHKHCGALLAALLLLAPLLPIRSLTVYPTDLLNIVHFT